MAEMTPLQKAQKILATKQTIKEAIATKGQNPTNVLDTYDDNILAIKTISKDGVVIDKDSNLEIEKTDVSSVTNDTTNKVLEVTVDDAGDVLLENGAGIEVAVGYDKVVAAAPIQAADILKGKSILGVEGTATEEATNPATAANIDKDKVAFVNGVKITGTSEKVDTSDANATAGDMLNNKTAYVNGQKITGSVAIPNDNMISVNELVRDAHSIYFNANDYASLVIHSINLKDDITDPDGTVDRTSVFLKEGDSIELRIEPQEFVDAIIQNDISRDEYSEKFVGAIGLTPDKIVSGNTILMVEGTAEELNGETKTVTPSTSEQTITPSAGKNAITEVTVNAVTSSIDSNITAANIKQGVEILGVTGTFTSDANATASDILVGKTAYVNGAKVTGTSTLEAEKEALENQIEDLRQELATITDADDAEAEMQTIINNLQDEITQLKTDKSSLEGQVTTLTAEKAALQKDLDDIEAVLDEINGEDYYEPNRTTGNEPIHVG